MLPGLTKVSKPAMSVLIRACMTRLYTRLSGGLWEREMLILASGDGLKTTGAKTSTHSLITLTHSSHTCAQEGKYITQQSIQDENRCLH